MGIFDMLGKQGSPSAPQGSPYEAMQKDMGDIKANPSSYLKSKGYNVPDNMTDAKQITQYLLQTGQVGTPRLRRVMQFLGMGR